MTKKLPVFIKAIFSLKFSLYLRRNQKLNSLLKNFETPFRTYINIPIILNFDYVLKNFDTIYAWLSSSEFKEKFKNQNHPYPSLLDPEKIDYESINARLAWELNLPLPQCDMVKFEGHGVGSAFLTLANRIGITGIYYQSYPSSYKTDTKPYILYYRALVKKTTRIIYIREYSLKYKKYKKYYALIPSPKIKTLNQVRDPVSMLKSYLTLRRSKHVSAKINLSFNTKKYLASLVGYGGKTGLKDKPNCELIERYINDEMMCFHDTKLFEALVNIKQVEFMDMSEIVGEKTIETMERFAKEFNVSKPKKEDKEFFTRRILDYDVLLHNTIIYVHKNDIEKINTDDTSSLEQEGGFDVYILKKTALEARKLKDISEEIFENISGLDIIRIGIDAMDYEKLKLDEALFKRTKSYLQEFVQNLIRQEKIEQNKAKNFTEEKVLEHLRENERARVSFKKVLDSHLALIKAHRPDIVASWKYYAEFERMCAELDG